ncbi:hypothetical protein BV20DRAFT_278525 [Pilatotrama ljubarskyi]|nr:hypothetical protein BV20DRAFT_278525 [Pilatotrama ljubarskyi]
MPRTSLRPLETTETLQKAAAVLSDTGCRAHAEVSQTLAAHRSTTSSKPLDCYTNPTSSQGQAGPPEHPYKVLQKISSDGETHARDVPRNRAALSRELSTCRALVSPAEGRRAPHHAPTSRVHPCTPFGNIYGRRPRQDGPCRRASLTLIPWSSEDPRTASAGVTCRECARERCSAPPPRPLIGESSITPPIDVGSGDVVSGRRLLTPTPGAWSQLWAPVYSPWVRSPSPLRARSSASRLRLLCAWPGGRATRWRGPEAPRRGLSRLTW